MFHTISLRSVQPGAFCGLKRLEELELSNNELTTAPELLPVKHTLRNLKLGKNEIHFPSDYFDGFDVLYAVNIEENGLYYVPNMGYIGHSLGLLSINNNKIKTLDERLTGGLDMTVLEDLRAHANVIQYINVAILAQMPKLKRLDIARNHLHQLADLSAYWYPDHVRPLELILHDNPLTCDKALSWLLVLTQQEIIAKGLGNDAECHQPPCLQGRDVMSLSKCLNTR